MNISNLPEQAETTVKKTELATKLRPQNYREISELGATRRPTTVGKSYIWLAWRGSCGNDVASKPDLALAATTTTYVLYTVRELDDR